MTVPISVTLPQFTSDPARLVDAAVMVEELGFHGAFVFDHLYPLGNRERPILEARVALGAVIAATRHLEVGSLVLRAPMRPIETTVQTAMTAWHLSDRRAVIGLGAADSLSRGEFEAYGVTYGSVGERIAVLRSVVEGIKEIGDADRPPVWVGGRSAVVRDLAFAIADGWNVWAAAPAWLRDHLAERPMTRPFTVSWGGQVLLALTEADLAHAVSARESVRGVVAGTAETVASKLRAIIDAGADALVLSLLGETWELFAETVLPRI